MRTDNKGKKPTVIMVTSNGVGAGHLIRASAIARKIQDEARPIILSMAYSVIEVANSLNIEAEYVPSRDKKLMSVRKWDRYLRDRIIALIDETDAKVVTFDGVAPYPGFIQAKYKRPEVVFIWVRRGMWRETPKGLNLKLIKKVIDTVIEPGDYAYAYDFGPTKNLNDAILCSPVSLYEPLMTLEKNKAKSFLGLDKDKTAVLLQLGVGATDLNERISAVLNGLSSWDGVEIVMAKEPTDDKGNSLLPKGVAVKTIRHFPLADVIHAFEAIICAAGYNSVHEVIPAGIPTLLIDNSRGTDDQNARARWCSDAGLTLFADSNSLVEIERKSSELKDRKVREKLKNSCTEVLLPNGASEIAAILVKFLQEGSRYNYRKRAIRDLYRIKSYLRKGFLYITKRLIKNLIYLAATIYRYFIPKKYDHAKQLEVIISDIFDSDKCGKLIKSDKRFEHILLDHSQSYYNKRKKIAKKTYRVDDSYIKIYK
jgi:UDP-N-acetylglucosamine:LPS N-acetylglucosamine transferase